MNREFSILRRRLQGGHRAPVAHQRADRELQMGAFTNMAAQKKLYRAVISEKLCKLVSPGKPHEFYPFSGPQRAFIFPDDPIISSGEFFRHDGCRDSHLIEVVCPPVDSVVRLGLDHYSALTDT